MAWATEAEVADVTGVTVSATELAQAEAVVNLYSGRTPDLLADRIGERDLYWLKQAVAWQAVWQQSQVGFDSRSSVGSVSQDGVSVSFRTEWQQVLAPLAARSLKNLSWKRSRTTSRRGRVYTNFLLESSDPYAEWADL